MKRIDEQILEIIGHIGYCDHSDVPVDMEDLVTQLQKIAKHTEDWRLAMESLTPGGSEFYNDMDYCTKWIQDRLIERHEAKKEVIRLQRQVRDLTDKVRDLTEGPPEICPECKLPHHPFDATNGERCWLIKGE